MKPKIIERKTSSTEESIDFENNMINVGCFFWPSKEASDLDLNISSQSVLSLLQTSAPN